MLRNRILFLLCVSFLSATAAWADDVGYVDCTNHSEDTQVFAKPRKTPDVIAAIPCGQRFTIVTYGFFFSRIQTGDGKVGYVYSSLIALDRAATAAQQAGAVRMATDKVKIPSAAPLAVKPDPPAPTAPQPASAQSGPAQVPLSASPSPMTNTSETAATAPQPNSTASAPTPSAPTQPTGAPASTAISSGPESTATVAKANPPAFAQSEPASAQPPPAPAPAPLAPSPSSNSPEPSAASAQPNPRSSEQPEPTPAPQPATPAIRPANDRTSWEKPNPTVRTAPLMELYGGYSFARLVSGGTGSNLNGAMGSFGWSLKPWLQIVADTSYNVVTTNGTKNVLYGNHYGPRFFRRGRNRWGITPFGETLFGGSRADTTITGSSGYTSSQNTFSMKLGGGLDIHPSRRWDIRLFDVDYYRTSFGTNVHQNNYWISTGIVLRLFGGGSE